MHNLVMKIKMALAAIESDKGEEFKIKCLVAKNPDDIQWDLVLAADWFEKDQIKRLDYLAEKILRDFDQDCMTQFSGIITVDANSNSELVALLKRTQENYSLGLYKNFNVLDNLFLIVETNNKLAQLVLPLNEYGTSA